MLARLTRNHGIPKHSILTLKADLFSLGGLAFSGSPTSVFLAAHPNGPFTEIPLSGPVSPLGGKWGQAKAVLLRFRQDAAPPIGTYVALPREQFPPLPPGEFYLCDAQNAQIIDEHGTVHGVYSAFEDVGPGATNLRARKPDGKYFEFPVAWVERFVPATDTSPPQLIVPGVEVWTDLKNDGERDDR